MDDWLVYWTKGTSMGSEIHSEGTERCGSDWGNVRRKNERDEVKKPKKRKRKEEKEDGEQFVGEGDETVTYL
jgi:hypothetical protein